MSEVERGTRRYKESKREIRDAGGELGRSLCRLGLAIGSSPLRLLPQETQQHLRAAGREAQHAGIALQRGVLQRSEEVLSEAHARLDEAEAELREREDGGPDRATPDDITSSR